MINNINIIGHWIKVNWKTIWKQSYSIFSIIVFITIFSWIKTYQIIWIVSVINIRNLNINSSTTNLYSKRTLIRIFWTIIIFNTGNINWSYTVIYGNNINILQIISRNFVILKLKFIARHNFLVMIWSVKPCFFFINILPIKRSIINIYINIG